MNACIVLAAGSSRRLGKPKQLLDLGGQALLTWTLGVARAFAPTRTVLILGHEAAAIRAVIDEHDLTVIVNHRYRDGMSTSLKAGIAVLATDVESVVILTGDQPFVTVEHLIALEVAQAQTGKPIAATRFDDYDGVPVLLAREAWPLVGCLSGDQGARPLLRVHPELVTFVRASSEDLGLDVDTTEAYARAVARLAERSS